MVAADLVKVSDLLLTGTASKNNAAGTISVPGNSSGVAYAEGVVLGAARMVVRLDSHGATTGAAIKLVSSLVAPTRYIDFYISSTFGNYFGHKNAADTGGTSTSIGYNGTPKYYALSYVNSFVVWEDSPDGVTWTVRRTSNLPENVATLNILVFEGRDGNAGDPTLFSSLNNLSANAGPDQTVAKDSVVTLTGTPAGGTWSQASGPAVALSAPATTGSETKVTFTASNNTTGALDRTFTYSVI